MFSYKMTEMWTTMGSTLASFMFIWAIIRQYCPYQLLRFFEKYSHRIMDYFYPYIRVSFHEFLGDRLKRSDAYGAVEAYLSANTSKSAKRLKAEIGKDSTNLVLTMDEYERVTDDYKGVKVYWVCSKVMSQSRSMPYYQEQEKRFYKLTFHKKYRDTITGSYLDHVMKEGKEIRLRNRQRKLYTNSPGYKWPSYKQTMWSHIVFEHPATFETMAMEPEKKKEIIEDLVTFSKSKDFYARIGKAWKRGYLLFGPPGTGKSTMIAAMANLLGYDVYDLELTEVHNNSELRKLLMKTSSKSIIVIEDIDCSINLSNRKNNKKSVGSVSVSVNSRSFYENGVGEMRGGVGGEENGNSITLSGLLNFTDGLWSCCGSERIFVFTTNHIEKLDPALLRSGRMDMHIFMSYCSIQALKILLKNYLGCEEGVDLDDSILKELEKVVEMARMTPADISEVLIKNRRKKEKVVDELLEILKVRAERNAKNGGVVRRENNGVGDEDDVEEEEQEKRALDSDSPKQESEIEDDCKEGSEEEEKIK